jgi:nucleotide-binding universal stress UspA family protein
MTDALLADLRQAAQQLVDDSGIRRIPELDVNIHVAAEPALDALVSAHGRAALLVLGAKHHSLLGRIVSVGRRTAAQATCPVALVPQEPSTAITPGDAAGAFIVGVDGSAPAAAALQWACEEAGRRNLPVRAITVSVSDELTLPAARDVQAMQERFPALALSHESLPGDPKQVLSEQAAASEALVVGQHGSGRALAAVVKRLPAVGSVSRWLATHPPAPVVVVPATD